MTQFLEWSGRRYTIPDQLTHRDLATAYQILEVRSSDEFESALKGHPNLAVAMLVIARRRAGEKVNVDELLDSPIGTIVIVDDEVPAGPPDEAADAAAPTLTSPSELAGVQPWSSSSV